MSVFTCVILGLWHTGWGHSSKFLYTCPLWPPRDLWCEGQGSDTWNDWWPLDPSGDDELFALFFRLYVGPHTQSRSSSLRGVTFQIHLASLMAVSTELLLLVTYRIVKAIVWCLWKLHCQATSSPSLLHAMKSDPNPGWTSAILSTRGVYSKDTTGLPLWYTRRKKII